jgi:hypothetical protein
MDGNFKLLKLNEILFRWVDDRMEGQGTFICKAKPRSPEQDSDEEQIHWQFNGEFKDNQKHGNGTLIYGDCKYEGNW